MPECRALFWLAAAARIEASSHTPAAKFVKKDGDLSILHRVRGMLAVDWDEDGVEEYAQLEYKEDNGEDEDDE